MDVRVAVPLGILVAAFALPFVLPAAVFFAWSLTLAGIYLLSREAAWRRAARAGMVALAVFVALGVVGAGAVFGWRGRTLAATEGLAGAALWGGILVLAGILATAVLLALAPIPRVRRLARAAAASGALLLLVTALVASGERIAGLIGFFGAVTLALVAASLVAALASTRGSGEPVSA